MILIVIIFQNKMKANKVDLFTTKKGGSEWNECSGKSIILRPTMREEGSPVLSSLQKISDINSENINM